MTIANASIREAKRNAGVKYTGVVMYVSLIIRLLWIEIYGPCGGRTVSGG